MSLSSLDRDRARRPKAVYKETQQRQATENGISHVAANANNVYYITDHSLHGSAELL